MIVTAILHDQNLIVHKTFAEIGYKFPDVINRNFRLIVSRVTPTQPYRVVAPTMNIIIQEGRGIADARRLALKKFIEEPEGHSHVMVVDFDRLLYWLTHDHSSLKSILNLASYSPFFIIGRTEAAMMTHPEPQRSTERAINAYTFDKLFPDLATWDIVAGTYVMDAAMAELILERSTAIDPGAVDVEWYALANMLVAPEHIMHVKVDGLGYEGSWLGLEPSDITDEIYKKRYDNLEHAKAMADAIKIWRQFSQ